MAVGTLFIYTESATHAGTGTGLGAIDLPIQRERTTDYPIIQGSGVKGSLRQQYPGYEGNLRPEEREDEAVKNKRIVFGPANEPDYGGAVAVGDARILAFPVRSLKGVLAWVTCRDVLARFARDAGYLGTESDPFPLLPNMAPQPQADYTEAYASSDAVVLDGSTIVLEDYQYRNVYHTGTVADPYFADDDIDRQNPPPIAWVWSSWLATNALPQTDSYKSYYHDAFASRFIILPDDDFRDFALYSTEVTTRIKLNRDTKTVDGTALFTMESLPADSLLYVPITTHKPRNPEDKFTGSSFSKDSTDETVLKWLQNLEIYPKRIQIGGDETVGYGQVALRWGGME